MMLQRIVALLLLLLTSSIELHISATGILHEEKFNAEVQPDEIIYTSINIPRYARSVDITIWQQSEGDLFHEAQVFIRYDGLPSIEYYDASFALPKFPRELRISDPNPTRAVMYLGLYGGQLLHSYRYFAGSPEYSFVHVQSSISTCASDLETGPDCESIEILPFSFSSSKFKKNLVLRDGSSSSDVMMAVSLPHDLESFLIDVSFSINSFCHSGNIIEATAAFSVDFYLEHAQEDRNAAMNSISTPIASLCEHSQELKLPIRAERPLSGIWKLKIAIIVESSNGTIADHAVRYASSGGEEVNELLIPVEIVTEGVSCPSGRTGWTGASISRGNNDSICLDKVVQLDVSRSPSIAAGYSSHVGRSIQLPAMQSISNELNTTRTYVPSAVFTAQLRANERSAAVGGGMQLQLIVTKMGCLQHFLLSLRVGGWPGLPTFESSSVTGGTRIIEVNEQTNRTTVTMKLASASSLLLSTRDAKIIRRQDGDVLFIWFLPYHPKLPYIFETNARLYMSVVREGDVRNNADSLIGTNVEPFSEAHSVFVQILFGPCGMGACEHGSCITKTGDVTAYSCSCRYPWAGESCNELSESYSFYLFQVACLVLSNAAMIPGIMISYHCNRPLVAVALTISMSASGMYHLCDSDAYCLFGYTFKSLQVLDVLFSTSCMAIILMLFAGFSSSIHSALSLLSLGLLITPVANDPTSPANIAFALIGAFIVCAVGHRWKIIEIFLYIGRNCLSFGMNRSQSVSSDGGVNNQVAMKTEVSNEVVHQDRRNGDVEYNRIEADAEPGWDDDDDNDSASRNTSRQYFEISSRSNNQTASTQILPQRGCLYLLSNAIIGLLLGVGGLTCFLVEGRDNYYYVHSLWHVLIMTSSYYLIKGCEDFRLMDDSFN